MGHYLSEMPDCENRTPTLTNKERVSVLWDWINTSVDVLRDHGGTMGQDDLERATAKVLGVSPVRMSWVITNAVAENLMSRGGLGKWDVLTLV